MPILKSTDLNKKFDYVLCDSKEALIHCYDNGLNKKISVITNSPSILLDKQIKSIPIDRKWSEKEYSKFQKSIYPFTLEIFNTIKKSKKYEIEIAILCAILGNQLSNFLIKFSFIDKSLLNKKILFVKLNDQLKGSDSINPPWTILSKKLNLYIFSYNPKRYSNIILGNNILPKLTKRILIGGLETLFFRIIMKYNISSFFKKNKSIFLINENEMIIETASKLFFSGFNIINFQNISLIKNARDINNLKELKKLLHQTFKNRIQQWVIPELFDECLLYFNKHIEKKIKNYNNWKLTFDKKIADYIKNNKNQFNNSIVFINHPSSPKGLAIKNIFNSYNTKVFSFQHGVTAEISDTHKYCLSQHDSSSSDVYMAFNKSSLNVARSSPFNQSTKQHVFGAPKRYKRTNNSFIKKKFSILYLSPALPMGNIGGVNSWCSDLYKAKAEINIINILDSINKKVFYKPYPEFNKRYYDKLKLYRNLGFTIPRFVHFIRGFNFRMTGYQAALVNNQLKRIKSIISKKIEIYRHYEENLKNIDGIDFQITKKNRKNVYWMVGILINKKYKLSKNQIQRKLKDNNVDTRNFFKSIAEQPCFSKIIKKSKKTPISKYLWENGIYLPSSYDITKKEINKICLLIKKYSQ